MTAKCRQEMLRRFQRFEAPKSLNPGSLKAESAALAEDIQCSCLVLQDGSVTVERGLVTDQMVTVYSNYCIESW